MVKAGNGQARTPLSAQLSGNAYRVAGIQLRGGKIGESRIPSVRDEKHYCSRAFPKGMEVALRHRVRNFHYSDQGAAPGGDVYGTDRDVPEFPMGNDERIHDASGSIMEFIALVEMLSKKQTVGGKAVKAKIHVSKVDDDVVTLGTNVLPRLGYRLVHERNAFALATQLQAEPARRGREEPMSSKNKKKKTGTRVGLE
ncbi:unnamed protein product [Heligmosomoides polygyrus]|uniref:ATP-dependent DNA helicase n=1 Tax=Heligmosomoides polygyrus TaxID=6339 RepID=A0A183GVW1_HELPZ|nr:unnamed protein product [Heligmosomoides polygyrus]